jgi:hypothetical protein
MPYEGALRRTSFPQKLVACRRLLLTRLPITGVTICPNMRVRNCDRVCQFAASLIFIIVLSTTGAQSHPVAFSYDVATVKPSDPNRPPDEDDIGYDSKTGVFNAVNQSLKEIIKFAYDLSVGTDQQISGGLKWVSSEKFDIVAKPDSGTTSLLQKLTGKERTQQIRLMVQTLLEDRFKLTGKERTQQIRLMVQTLLEDRFKLRVHHDTRVLPVLSLSVDKKGLKITPSKMEADAKRWEGIRGRPGQLEGKACEIALFANVLTALPEVGGRLVLNRTGLTGKYDFMLKWTPDSTLGPSSIGSAISPDDSAPSLFTAIAQQLGLKLEATKGSVDTIVIDSVAMPSPN